MKIKKDKILKERPFNRKN